MFIMSMVIKKMKKEEKFLRFVVFAATTVDLRRSWQTGVIRASPSLISFLPKIIF